MIALLLLLAQDAKPVAKWEKIPKGTRFSFSWTFSLKHTGEDGGNPILRVDSRKVEGELIADSDIQGRRSLRLVLGAVTWTYANPDSEVTVTRTEEGETNSSIRCPLKGAEAKALAKADQMIGFLKDGYQLPVDRAPMGLGQGGFHAWSSGDVINSLFDWMMIHDDLGDSGRAAGTSWEISPRQSDMDIGSGGGFSDKKLKLHASSITNGVRVSGSLSDTTTHRSEHFGNEAVTRSLSREWSFVDGYFAGGKRTISAKRERTHQEKFWQVSTSFSVQESLTIRRK